MNWDQVSEQLAAPLDPAAIKPPPQGKFGEYVDGLHVIREANRIFGFNGWSYTVERLERTHYEIIDLPNGKQLRTSYLCAVRVSVDGVVREGLAVGVGNGKPENAGDVIESAVKEAETDALKRALRTFGNTFGLALYEKDKSKREVEARPDTSQIDAYRVPMLAEIEKKTAIPSLLELKSHQKWKADIEKLRAMSREACAEVETALAAKQEELEHTMEAA